MAEELADGEFWLPSEFLADDVFLEEDEKKMKKNQVESGGGVCFPSEFPYAYDSNPSSPVESAAETESSDEEEQRQRAADLTLQMGRASLRDDDKWYSSAFATGNSKLGLASSPQSTLCAMRSLSMSSRGSSDGPSQVSSPPSPLEPQSSNDAWGVLYAAAGQVVRMKRHEDGREEGSFSARGLLGPPKETTTTTGYYSNPAISQHQLQVTRFQQLKQQQLLKQQCSAGWGRQNKGRGGGYGVGNGRVTGRPWPPPQQQTQMGSGMTAVFLGGGTKRESGGTGVFLPRRAGGSPPEMRRKPACSTVLLPARVVQALNLDLDEIGAHPVFPGGFVLDHDAIRARSNAMLLQRKRQQSLSAQQAVGFNNESRLPPDWTY